MKQQNNRLKNVLELERENNEADEEGEELVYQLFELKEEATALQESIKEKAEEKVKAKDKKEHEKKKQEMMADVAELNFRVSQCIDKQDSIIELKV